MRGERERGVLGESWEEWHRAEERSLVTWIVIFRIRAAAHADCGSGHGRVTSKENGAEKKKRSAEADRRADHGKEEESMAESNRMN